MLCIATTVTEELELNQKAFSVSWHKNDTRYNKEVTTMLLISLQQPTVPPKVKAIPENVRENLELLGVDFSEFDKCKAG